MGSARTPRVYSIPPGVPYLATFAQAYLAGEIIPGVGAQQGPSQRRFMPAPPTCRVGLGDPPP